MDLDNKIIKTGQELEEANAKYRRAEQSIKSNSAKASGLQDRINKIEGAWDGCVSDLVRMTPWKVGDGANYKCEDTSVRHSSCINSGNC